MQWRAILVALAVAGCTSEGLLLESRHLEQGGTSGFGQNSITLVTRPAGALADSVGLSVRLRNAAELASASEAFSELKVKHARMFLPPPSLSAELEHVAALGAAGVRWHLIVDPRFGYRASTATELIESQPSLESLEGPNDHDAYDSDLSVEEIRGAILDLRAAIDAASRPVALVDGLDSTATGVGDLSNALDFGNFERSRTREMPGADITDRVNEARDVCGDKPLFVTECGYSNFEGNPQFVSEEVAARYVPRLFLAHFELGIVRTYLDELSDEASPQTSQGAQGLLRGDGSKKPAYEALRRFVSRVSDTTAAATATITLGFARPVDSLRITALSRSDDTTLLLIWNEVASADAGTGMPLQPEPVSTTIELAEPTKYSVYRPLTADLPISTGRSANIEVSVADDVLILELEP